MNRIIVAAALSLVLFSADAAMAQERPAGTPDRVRADVEEIVERSGVVEALDALAAASTPELERTLDQLTATLNALTDRIVNDRELRVSAARAAQGMVEVANVVVVEQSHVLQDALRAAAEQLAEVLRTYEPAPASR
jgi:ABC-type transporter Mla subunit MlaD